MDFHEDLVLFHDTRADVGHGNLVHPGKVWDGPQFTAACHLLEQGMDGAGARGHVRPAPFGLREQAAGAPEEDRRPPIGEDAAMRLSELLNDGKARCYWHKFAARVILAS